MTRWHRIQMRQADQDAGGAAEVAADALEAAETAAGPGGDRTEPAGFSQADLDRIVSDRLRRERDKMQREIKSQVEAARTEAERLAQMTADERAREEAQKRQQALEAREAALTRREVRAQALEALAERGLPKGLAETLDCSSADACQASLAAVEKAFRAAVEAEVNNRLRAPEPPKAGVNRPIETQDLPGSIRAKLFPDKPQ